MNQKRRFTPEFKKEAVALVTEQHHGGLSDDERAELKLLRKEIKELRLEKEILKKASAFFAKHMS